MPAIQTTYSANIAAAYAGMIASDELNNVISRTVKTAAIGFGKAVSQGTNAREVIPPSPGNMNIVGITVRDRAVDPSSPEQYRVNDTAGIATKGVVWVVVSGAVTVGAPAYVTTAGAITATVGSNTLIPNSRFDAAGADATLVPLRLG